MYLSRASFGLRSSLSMRWAAHLLTSDKALLTYVTRRGCVSEGRWGLGCAGVCATVDEGAGVGAGEWVKEREKVGGAHQSAHSTLDGRRLLHQGSYA